MKTIPTKMKTKDEGQCDICDNSVSKTPRAKSKRRRNLNTRVENIRKFTKRNITECLEDELVAYFLCTHFFGVKVFSGDSDLLLESCFGIGAGNPSQWIELCEVCRNIVRQAKDLHYEMTRIQHKVSNLRGQLVERLQPEISQTEDPITAEVIIVEIIRQKLQQKLTTLSGQKGCDENKEMDEIIKLEVTFDEEEGSFGRSPSYDWSLGVPSVEEEDADFQFVISESQEKDESTNVGPKTTYSVNDCIIKPDYDDDNTTPTMKNESTDDEIREDGHTNQNRNRRKGFRQRKQRKIYTDCDEEGDMWSEESNSNSSDYNYPPEIKDDKGKKTREVTRRKEMRVDSNKTEETKIIKKSPTTRKPNKKEEGSGSQIGRKKYARKVGSVAERTCPVCNEIFGRVERLKDHINFAHSKSIVYSCDNKSCEKVFYSNEALRKHVKCHLTAEEVKHLVLAKKLDDVKYEGALPEGALLEIDTEAQPNEKIVNRILERTCPICKKLFPAAYRKVRHVELVHSRTESEPNDKNCDISKVEKITVTAEQIKHLRLANKLNAVNYSDHLDKDGKKALSVCLNSEETYDPKIVKSILDRTCEICKEIFTNKFRKDSHVTRVHQRPSHICEKCGKSFVYLKSLALHLKFHDKTERDYKCDVAGCDGAFKKPDILRRHKKLVHEKTYQQICPFCGKVLCTANNLRVHILTLHTENAPKKFQCNFCPKSFLTKVLLTQHLNSKLHGGPGGNIYRKRNVTKQEQTATSNSAESPKRKRSKKPKNKRSRSVVNTEAIQP